MAGPSRSATTRVATISPGAIRKRAGDDVIAPAAAVEAHGDEEAGDGEEAVHRVLAKGEARGEHQRLVVDAGPW